MELPALNTEHLRALVFFGLLVVVGSIERLRPQRLSDPQRLMRWPSNFGLVALGTVLLAALPLTGLAVADAVSAAGFGLFNQVAGPAAVEIGLSLLLLDLGIYAQHRAMHEWPALWRLHRVHHSDVEFDVTTALRFHPAELLLSQLYKLSLYALLGAPWVAVVAFEILLSAGALWTHANLRLAPRLSAALGWLLVTPDLHRVHHSVHVDETHRNYGTLLSLWDRLFASYRAQPRDGHRGMRIGLAEFRHPSQQVLGPLLMQPLQAGSR
jgi:sterol desaturase/sphingolipid hydroxylase (fatty acid hydroxylase superfamily)